MRQGRPLDSRTVDNAVVETSLLEFRPGGAVAITVNLRLVDAGAARIGGDSVQGLVPNVTSLSDIFTPQVLNVLRPLLRSKREERSGRTSEDLE